MAHYIGIGALGIFIVIHLLAMIVTAAYGPLIVGAAPLECAGIPSFACGSPFQDIAVTLEGAEEFGVLGMLGLFRSFLTLILASWRWITTFLRAAASWRAASAS